MKIILPKKGVQGEKRRQALTKFSQSILPLKKIVDFGLGSRGYCYIAENLRIINKSQFNYFEKLINECRTKGFLPLNFTTGDDNRRWNLYQDPSESIDEYLKNWLYSFKNCSNQYEVDFWEDSPVYIQAFVEKIDLIGLFAPIAKKYHVPLANMRGWSDINSRAEMAKRFEEAEYRGQRLILLLCNDHDPTGLQISDKMGENLDKLSIATGWEPTHLEIDRFGLNKDFIDEHELTWIDNLETSRKKDGKTLDLSDPKHPSHKHANVQSYLRKYGSRKCEANALVINPEVGRELFEDTILNYLPSGWLDEREERLAKKKREVDDLVKDYLK